MSKQVAWQVSEWDEGHCVIVFHSHGLAARRLGADELNQDFEDVEVKRAPMFDHFADQGFVPIKSLLEAGWWYTCTYCETQISEDTHNLDGVVIESEHAVFCNDHCCSEHHRQRAEDIAKQAAVFEQFKAEVKPLLKGCTDIELRGEWPQLTCVASFRYPGCTYSANIRRSDSTGKLVAMIPQADLQAWAAFRENS